MQDNYIMYLRKSRADNQYETVEEVLSKHETMLQDMMRQKFGYEIAERNIYREVVSGESIAEREKMKQMLARCEDPNILAVVCADPQRLTRGDLIDCGYLINILRYTNTKVITPLMTFDLTNQMEQRHFQDELVRGGDYLSYTKRILLTGRENAVKRGAYIAQYAPFGYDKIKIDKMHTLVPNADAETVRMIFDWYVNEDLTYHKIACRLNEMGIPSAKGNKWVKDSVRHILNNDHYDGKVFFNRIKKTKLVEGGELITKKLAQPSEKVIMCDGLHPAIVDHDIFVAAKEKRANNPRNKTSTVLRNPLAGMLRCAKCGRALILHPYPHAFDRVECRTRPRCFKSARLIDVLNAVTEALLIVHLPDLEAKAGDNSAGKAAKQKQQQIDRLKKQLEEYRIQEQKQYDFLESGRYTEEVFDARHHALKEKMNLCRKQIEEAQASKPAEVDYSEKALTLKQAICTLHDDTISAEDKNKLLKAIVDRIEMVVESEGKEDLIKLDIHLKF